MPVNCQLKHSQLQFIHNYYCIMDNFPFFGGEIKLLSLSIMNSLNLYAKQRKSDRGEAFFVLLIYNQPKW